MQFAEPLFASAYLATALAIGLVLAGGGPVCDLRARADRRGHDVNRRPGYAALKS